MKTSLLQESRRDHKQSRGGSPFDGCQAGCPVQFKILDDVSPDFHRAHSLDTKVNGTAMTVLRVGCPYRTGTVTECGILIISPGQVIIDRDRLPEAIPDKLRYLKDFWIDEPD